MHVLHRSVETAARSRRSASLDLARAYHSTVKKTDEFIILFKVGIGCCEVGVLTAQINAHIRISEFSLLSDQDKAMPQSSQPQNEVFLAFQIIPRLKSGNNFELVDKAIDVVKKANVPFQVGAMETTMKGELDTLLDIVKEAQQKCLNCGALEVITNIKIHIKTPEASDTFCTYDRGVTPNNSVFMDK